MTTYEYNFDREHFEIFPEDIWSDPNIVFHGTSEYHSEQIEEKGLLMHYSPFDLEEARALIDVLKKPEVADFDYHRGLNSTTVSTLEEYIQNIENHNFRLSFAYLSYLSAFYSSGRRKGGQIIGIIRDAHDMINEASTRMPKVLQYITPPIKHLFQLADDIANTNGVVYAIKLIEPYSGINNEYGTILSTNKIDVDSIIGKVILPNDINSADSDFSIAKKMNGSKLVKNGNLGVRLYRLQKE